MADKDDEIAAARELSALVFQKLTDEQGVHAETAISAAARMAGTFLLRSCGLPLATLTPGAPVLSDAVNEQGPLLVELFELVLRELQVPVDAAVAKRLDPAPPRLAIGAMQALLDVEFTAVADRHGLDADRLARAGAIAAAMIVKQAGSVIDPNLAFATATYGFVEGAKTVPPPLGWTGPARKKPWYKLW